MLCLSVCHSQRHGRGILKTLQGNWYDGEFRGNLKHGQGKMRYYDGDTYDGGWRDDMVTSIGYSRNDLCVVTVKYCRSGNFHF